MTLLPCRDFWRNSKGPRGDIKGGHRRSKPPLVEEEEEEKTDSPPDDGLMSFFFLLHLFFFIIILRENAGAQRSRFSPLLTSQVSGK